MLYFSVEFIWSENATVPKQIDKLLIGDTALVVQILNACLLTPEKLMCTLKNINLQIYKTGHNNYVITCEDKKEINGLLVEELSQWINISKEIYVLTSTSLAFYQGANNDIDNIYFLSTKKNEKLLNGYKKLNAPNLVTGFGTAIFSYCSHIKKDCTLFNSYVSYVPIDTLSSKPFIDLLQFLHIGNLLPFKINKSAATHNLYM